MIITINLLDLIGLCISGVMLAVGVVLMIWGTIESNNRKKK